MSRLTSIVIVRANYLGSENFTSPGASPFLRLFYLMTPSVLNYAELIRSMHINETWVLPLVTDEMKTSSPVNLTQYPYAGKKTRHVGLVDDYILPFQPYNRVLCTDNDIIDACVDMYNKTGNIIYPPACEYFAYPTSVERMCVSNSNKSFAKIMFGDDTQDIKSRILDAKWGKNYTVDEAWHPITPIENIYYTQNTRYTGIRQATARALNILNSSATPYSAAENITSFLCDSKPIIILRNISRQNCEAACRITPDCAVITHGLSYERLSNLFDTYDNIYTGNDIEFYNGRYSNLVNTGSGVSCALYQDCTYKRPFESNDDTIMSVLAPSHYERGYVYNHVCIENPILQLVMASSTDPTYTTAFASTNIVNSIPQWLPVNEFILKADTQRYDGNGFPGDYVNTTYYSDYTIPSEPSVYSVSIKNVGDCEAACDLIPTCVATSYTLILGSTSDIISCQFYDECAPARMIPFHNVTKYYPDIVNGLSSALVAQINDVDTKPNCENYTCNVEVGKYTYIVSMRQAPIVPKHDLYPFSSKGVGIDYKYNVLSLNSVNPIEPFYTSIMMADLGGALYAAIEGSMPELYNGIYTSADALRSERGVFDNNTDTCVSLSNKRNGMILITVPPDNNQTSNVSYWCDEACEMSCSNQNYTSGYWGVYNDINRTCSTVDIHDCKDRCYQIAVIADVKAASPDIFSDIMWIQTDVTQWEAYCQTRIHSDRITNASHRWTYTNQLHTPLHSKSVFPGDMTFEYVVPAVLASKHFITLPGVVNIEDLIVSNGIASEGVSPMTARIWNRYDLSMSQFLSDVNSSVYGYNNTIFKENPNITMLGSVSSIGSRVLRGYIPILDCAVVTNNPVDAFTLLFNCYPDVKDGSDITTDLTHDELIEFGRCYDVFSTNASISNVTLLLEYGYDPILMSNGDVYVIRQYEESVAVKSTPVQYAQLGPDITPRTTSYDTTLFNWVSSDNSGLFKTHPDYISSSREEPIYIHCETHTISPPDVWIETTTNNANTISEFLRTSEESSILCNGVLDLPRRYIDGSDVYKMGTRLYRIAAVSYRAQQYIANTECELDEDCVNSNSWGASIGIAYYGYLGDPTTMKDVELYGPTSYKNSYYINKNISNTTRRVHIIEYIDPKRPQYSLYRLPVNLFSIDFINVVFDCGVGRQDSEGFDMPQCWGYYIGGDTFEGGDVFEITEDGTVVGTDLCGQVGAKSYDREYATCVILEECNVVIPPKKFCSYSHAPPVFNSSTSRDYYKNPDLVGYSSDKSVRSPSVYSVQGGNKWIPGYYHRMPNVYYRSTPNNYAWGTGGPEDISGRCRPSSKNYYYLLPTGEPPFYPTMLGHAYWIPPSAANTPYTRQPNNISHVMVASRHSQLEITFTGSAQYNNGILQYYNITRNASSYYMKPFYEDQGVYYTNMSSYKITLPIPPYDWENVQSEEMENPYTSPLLYKTLQSKCGGIFTKDACAADISCDWVNEKCMYVNGTRCWRLNDNTSMSIGEKKRICQSGPCVWLRVNSDGISGTPLNQEGTLYLDKSGSTDDYKCIPLTHKIETVTSGGDGYGGSNIVNYTRLVSTSDSILYESTTGYQKGIYSTYDDISYYKCPETLAGVFPGTCLKPSTHLYAGYANGSYIVPSKETQIFDPDPYPLYEQCPVYDSGAETFVDSRLFVFSKSMERSVPFSEEFTNPLQTAVHYCQEFESPEGLRAFPYCENDPYTPVQKSRLCVQGGGDQLMAGRTFTSSLSMEDLCYSTGLDYVCFYIPGNNGVYSITNLIQQYKSSGHTDHRLTIYIVPFELSTLMHLIFNPVVYDVSRSVIIADNSEVVKDGNTITQSQKVSKLNPPFYTDTTSQQAYDFFVSLSGIAKTWKNTPGVDGFSKTFISAITKEDVVYSVVVIEESEILIDIGQITVSSIDQSLVVFSPILSPIFTVLSGNFTFQSNTIITDNNALPVRFVGSVTGDSIVGDIELIGATTVCASNGMDSIQNPNLPFIPFVDITGLTIYNIMHFDLDVKDAFLSIAMFARSKGEATVYDGKIPTYTADPNVVTFKQNIPNEYISWSNDRIKVFNYTYLSLVGDTVQWTGIPISVSKDLSWSITDGDFIKWDMIQLASPHNSIFVTPKGAPYACLSPDGDTKFVLCDASLYGNGYFDESSIFTSLLPQPGDCKDVAGPQIFACAGVNYQSKIYRFSSTKNCTRTESKIHISDLPMAIGLEEDVPFIPGAFFSCVSGDSPVMLSGGYGAYGYVSKHIIIQVLVVSYYGDVIVNGEGTQDLNLSDYTGANNYGIRGRELGNSSTNIFNNIVLFILFTFDAFMVIIVIITNYYTTKDVSAVIAEKDKLD